MVEPDPKAPVIKIDLGKKVPKSILSISGWGAGTDTGLAIPIKHLELEIQEPSKCAKQFEDKFVPEKEICVEGREHKGTLCHGDSGSPVIYNDKLVGVVSYGSIPCSGQKIGVIQNISAYMNWIKEHVPNLGKGYEFSNTTSSSSTDNDGTTSTANDRDSNKELKKVRESHLDKNQGSKLPSKVDTNDDQNHYQSKNEKPQSVNPEIQHSKQDSSQDNEFDSTVDDQSTPGQGNMQPKYQKESTSTLKDNQWPQNEENSPSIQGRKPFRVDEPQPSSEKNYQQPQEQVYDPNSNQDIGNYQDGGNQLFAQDRNNLKEEYEGQSGQEFDQNSQRFKRQEHQPEYEQDNGRLQKFSQGPNSPNAERIVDPELSNPQSTVKSPVSFTSPVKSYSYEL